MPEMTCRHINGQYHGSWESNRLTFYKTLFARMNNIKAGVFTDGDGEALNDVEKVLKELDIDLRDVNGQFRNSGDVLDEVGKSWDNYDNVQQHAIATAFAGTRQQEKFLVLMENYADATNYAAVATDSIGTATGKYAAHTESIQGKMESLKATMEMVSTNLLNSDIVASAVDTLRVILEIVGDIVEKTNGLAVIIPALSISLASLIGLIKTAVKSAKLSGIITELKGLIKIIPAIVKVVATFVANIKAGNAAFDGMKTALQGTTSLGWITLAIALLSALITKIQKTQNAWKETQEELKSQIEESEKLISKTEDEIAALYSLQQRLDEAKGNRAELAALYDELNSSISTSAELLKGEENAHKAATIAIKEQIEAKRKLKSEEAKARKELLYDSFYNNKLDRKGLKADLSKEDVSFNSFGENYITNDNIDEALPYYTPYNILRGFNYDGFNALTKENQEKVLKHIGVTRENWDNYWSQQIETAQEYYESEINEAYGIIGDNAGSIIKSLVANGVGIGTEEMDGAISELLYNTEITELMNKYHYALAAGSNDSAAGLYSQIIAAFDGLVEKYPQVKNVLDSIASSITIPPNSRSMISVELKGTTDVLNEVQPGFDGIVDALTDMSEYGVLTSDTLSNLFELEEKGALAGIKLSDVLTKTANGYELNSNTLKMYIESLIKKYTLEKALMSHESKVNTLENFKTLRAVLLSLINAQQKATDVAKDHKKALNDQKDEYNKQKDAYDEQLDKYKELIDLRKELLDTYKEELEYQRELEKKQLNVARLQARLSVAKLDKSASGQARVRELEEELKEAQEELDDYTLEHAIDVLISDLDSQYSEYENFIKVKLDEIENALDELDDAINSLDTSTSVVVDTSWAQELIDMMAPIVEALEADLALAFEKAQSYILKNKMLEGDRARWGQDPKFYKLWAQLTEEERKNLVAYTPGVYHSGGIVGDVVSMSSNEEFAKLLKGEFVSTPTQMKNFMEHTLPNIASYNSSSGNEFNAPLIEINCDNVTSEAMPTLKDIVNNAVSEIKRQLDSGVSRTGYRAPVKKLLI